ncbi:MAG: membrane protein insertion efficiency factor YidD [bacterium]|nr:membrane protein insertion efficiency factor YidD [bacterium]
MKKSLVQVQKGLLLLIKIYQGYISILFPPTCRFFPSCSEYAHQAITRYGMFKGLWLTIRRLLKCHPFHPGGDDPVL